MPSRLSSLLVRDGLVGVKRMEKAFQRQVIYGGSLDTTLLEMGLVPEDRLTQYLSLTSGLPPANRAECNVFDAEAVRRCPEDVATRFRVVPLSLEAGSLRALVHDPVDMAALEELADELDVAVQPLIVPEYRWHMVFVRTYGGQASARFSTLARQAEAAPAVAPVGRARTVIVEHGDERAAEDRVVDVSPPLAPIGPEAVTMRLTALTDEQAAAPIVPSPPRERSERSERRVTQVGVAMPAPAPVTITADEPAPGEPASPPIVGRSRTAEMATPVLQAHLAETEARRREASGRHAPVASAPPGATPSDGVPTRALQAEADPHAPLTVPRARELIAGATERDAVFMSLLRALRSKTRWAGILTVQGGAAIGRVAIAEQELDVTAMPSVLVPLDVPSPFRATITAMHPYVGPLSVGHAELDVMLARMGGTVPPTGLLLPIVLRERTVALAVAHRGPGTLALAEVTELLPLAGATADALGRLIARTKAVGYRAPTVDPAAPRAEVDVATVPNKLHALDPLRGPGPRKAAPRTATWSVPEAPVPTEVALAAPVPEPAPPPPPIGAVIDRIEADDATDAAAAMVAAITRADETLPEVARRFPGRLRVDRYRVSGRALPPGQYGGLLELVVQLGVPAGELLVERLNDPSRDVRFYAAVCLAHLRLRSAVYPLVERLFDSDYGVRACALEALSQYPARDVDLAMVRARHALHSEVLERVEAAASAIAELGDRAAIPDLIDIVGRDARRADHARRALVTLTRIDHGTSERKWRRWWEEHREQHRLEWLIDALGGKDSTLRVAAFEDLRRLTGESLGSADDVGRRDRSDTRERWGRWWHDFGRRRFVRDDDERLRPTAMLPVRRE